MTSKAIQDFSGGITDYILEQRYDRAEVCNNLLLNEDNKLRSRYGNSLFQTNCNQIPAGSQRIGHLDVFNDKLIAQSSSHLYVAESTGWEEIKGDESTYALANDLKRVYNLHAYSGHASSLIYYNQFKIDSDLDFSYHGTETTSEQGTVTVSGGVFDNDTTFGSIDNLVNYDDGLIQEGCVRFKYKSVGGGNPANGGYFFFINFAGGVFIGLSHILPSGKIRLWYGDGINFWQSPAVWNPGAGTWYEWEVNWKRNLLDPSDSVVRVFLDGILYSPVLTNFIGAVTGNTSHIYIAGEGSNKLDGVYDDFQVFNQVQHIANYAPAAFAPVSDSHATDPDGRNFVHSPDATGLTSLITLTSEFLLEYNAHDDDAELGANWLYHGAQESTNATLDSIVAPTTMSECITRLNDVKEKFNIHERDATPHSISEARQAYLPDALSNDVLINTATSNYVDSETWQKHKIITSDVFDNPQMVTYDQSEYRTLTVGLPNLLYTPVVFSSGAGGNSYIYYFAYYREHTIDDVTYIQYGPITSVTVSSVDAPDSAAIKFDQIRYPENTDDNYGYTKLHCFRTENNGTVAYYVSEITSNIFIDISADSTINTNDTIYTTGGNLDRDPVPPSKYITILNNVAFYGYVVEDENEKPYRIRISLFGMPWSCPASLKKDLDNDVTGLTNHFNNVIAFTEDRHYRLTGYYDDTGAGIVTVDMISDESGCVSHNGIVKTTEGIYYPAKDGFWFTNGYQSKKISPQINLTYKTLVSSATKRKKIYGANNILNDEIWWSVQETEDDNDRIYVYDKRTGSFRTVDNNRHSHVGSSEYTVAPTALLFSDISSTPYGGSITTDYDLIAGHRKGYVFRHTDEWYSDLEPLSAASPNDPSVWYRLGVAYTYKSNAFNFGSDTFRKYAQYVYFYAYQTAGWDVQVSSYNDLTSTELPCAHYNNPDSVGFLEGKLRFPKNTLRFTRKQVEIKNTEDTVLHKSDDHDDAVITGTTVALDSGLWPTDIKGYKIYFSSDNYVQEYYIIAVSGANVTVNSGPGNGAVSWEIRGIRKEQPLMLAGYEVQYDEATQSQPAAQQTHDGGND